MSDMSKLQELLLRQSKLSEQIASELNESEFSELKSQIETLNKRNEELSQKVNDLSQKNAFLTETLKSKTLAERARIIDRSKRKMHAYFGKAQNTQEDNLSRFESDAKQSFSRVKKMLDSKSEQLRQKFSEQIEKLEKEIYDEINRLKNESVDNAQEAARYIESGAQQFEQAQPQEDYFDASDSVEHKVGLNWLGKIGVFIILLGAVGLAQILYKHLPDAVNCVIMFLIATAFLGLGIFSNWKGKRQTVFSITILSLGIALEYTALAVTYFVLEILVMWAALLICLAITALSLFISLRVKNEVVACFAQIGGYLPVIAVIQALLESDMVILYAAMVYFLVLNVLGFVLSLKHKWQILNYISFGLNICAVMIVSIGVALLYYMVVGYETIITLIFMFFSFALHTLLPVLTNIRKNTRFTKEDFILIALVTAVNLVMFYAMFGLYGLADYRGWLSLLFSACYFGLYFLVRKFFRSDSYVRMLFWMTGIVFLTLFMPMHFELTFLSFGWLMMFGLLTVYGILRENKTSLYTGTFGGIISLVYFLIIDAVLGDNIVNGYNVFIYKYSLLTVLAIAILAALIYKRKLIPGYLTTDRQVFIDENIGYSHIYAGAVYVNTTLYLAYLIFKIFDYTVPDLISSSGIWCYFWLSLTAISMFIMSVFVPKLLKLKSIRNVSIVIAICAIALLLINNYHNRLPAFEETASAGELAASIFLTSISGILSLYVFYDLMKKLCDITSFGRKHIAASMSVYFLYWYTFIMIWQYRLEFINVWISIIYILTALGCLIYGFLAKNSSARRFALILTGVSLIKIFLVDTWKLELEYRTINYFVFGVVFIGMSLLYQFFYKKLEKQSDIEGIEGDPKEISDSAVSAESSEELMTNNEVSTSIENSKDDTKGESGNKESVNSDIKNDSPAASPAPQIAAKKIPSFCARCGTFLIKNRDGSGVCPYCGLRIMPK